MRMPRFVYTFISLMLAVPIVIASAFERTVDWLLGFVPTLASAPRLAVAGPTLALDEGDGQFVEPALLNALRHEAGMRRLN
jgi:hypothetical protein